MRYLFIVLSQNGDGDGNPDESEELLLTGPAAVASGASGPLGDSDTRFTLIEWRLSVSLDWEMTTGQGYGAQYDG